MVELQPSKLNVASSSLVSRSRIKAMNVFKKCAYIKVSGRSIKAHVAQSVERFLGKEEVHRFNPGRGLQFNLCFLDCLSCGAMTREDTDF